MCRDILTNLYDLLMRLRLLVTLRYLATGETFRSLGYALRMSVPSSPDYLKTPTNKDEWLKIAYRFEKKWNFPMFLDSLDGKHIAFRARKADGSYYFNYKHFNSISLMALVDADYNFIYVDVGCNGRASDGGVYNNSSLYKAIENNLLDIPENAVLPKSNIKVRHVFVADDAFRLSTHLMKQCGQRCSQNEKVF
ncbi:uncharacterized protein [Diabrotica undecimpunctata]|uniref:uncharacterized protein n=1 Tax=Diabrotica undecimpunctata TaxID=50387 RepID=UPI003B63D1B7